MVRDAIRARKHARRIVGAKRERSIFEKRVFERVPPRPPIRYPGHAVSTLLKCRVTELNPSRGLPVYILQFIFYLYPAFSTHNANTTRIQITSSLSNCSLRSIQPPTNVLRDEFHQTGNQIESSGIYSQPQKRKNARPSD